MAPPFLIAPFSYIKNKIADCLILQILEVQRLIGKWRRQTFWQNFELTSASVLFQLLWKCTLINIRAQYTLMSSFDSLQLVTFIHIEVLSNLYITFIAFLTVIGDVYCQLLHLHLHILVPAWTRPFRTNSYLCRPSCIIKYQRTNSNSTGKDLSHNIISWSYNFHVLQVYHLRPSVCSHPSDVVLSFSGFTIRDLIPFNCCFWIFKN